MKKIFTLALAMLASVGLMAQTTLATFEVTLTAAPTTAYASYDDDDATYTCNKVGSNSSSNYAVVGGHYYMKLTANDAYVKIKLKNGNFQADDSVTVFHNHTSGKNGVAFSMSNGGAAAASGNATANTELALGYNLKAADIAEDGSISIFRSGSNLYVGKITVIRKAAIVDPVAEVTVAGAATASIGYPAVYTASTDVKADAYKWFVNDVEQDGATAKSFTFTPAASGSYSIVCKARNANNVTDEWIASDAKVVKAYTLHGELIKATHTGNTTATVTGIIGGTADKNTSSDGKLNSGNYFGITLASGNFQAGDTLNVNLSAAASGGSCILVVYADKEATQEILNTGAAGVVGDNKLVLPSAANNKNSLYIVRNDNNGNWNGKIASMSVIRPMAAKSTVVSLSAVTINDVAISESDLNKLVSGSSHTLILEDSYLNAPVVKFTKHTVITYEDDSQKVSDEVIEKTSTQATASTWGASATIGENSYSVYTVKTMSYVVTYMFGTEELGTENVAQNGSPANYATYQTLNDGNLSTFAGWYNDADLAEGHAVADIAAEVITANTTYYAKFNYKYAESVNIEQLILDNGKSYDLMSLMGSKNYASNWTNDLDSLNDTKTARNEPYLGQKVKAAGKLLNFRLANGSVVKVKFGNVGKTPQASINGADYADITITDGVYTYTAEAETLISIKTVDNNTVVFKQIMIDEEIQTVVLPDKPTALDNAEASVKATKRIVNGQLFIEKNGVMYNAQGVVVR